jgi:hypothetical protein
MAHVRQVGEGEADGPIGPVYDAALKRAGGIANIIRVMSLDGAGTAASMGLYVSLMKRTNALAADKREMLATVVSCINDCYY